VSDSTQADSSSLRVVAAEELPADDSSSNESSAGGTDTGNTSKVDAKVSDTAKTAVAEQTDQPSSTNQPANSQSVQQSDPDVTKPDSAPVPEPHVQAVSDRTAEAEAAAMLVLNAADSSWVEVKDATEKRLYYQLLNAGEQISLEGQPPYSVFLGNARQVRVEINNQIVDFDHLIKGNRKTVNMKVENNAAVTLNTKR